MSPCAPSTRCPRDLKGKGRAVDPVPPPAALYGRDGDEDGIVLPLTLIQTTAYET